MQPQIERYEGPNPKDGMLAGVRGFLSLNDEDLGKVTAHYRQSTPPMNLHTEELGHLMVSINELLEAEPACAHRALDILAHVRMYNAACEDNQHYIRMTFTPGLTDENHGKCVDNVNRAEDVASKRARIIIDKVTGLEESCRTDA